MKKILSTKYSSGAFNFAIFILRVTVGVLLAHHGYDKLIHFSTMKDHFMNFLGIGSATSLSLDIFAEFFCAIFLILGLFTRLAVIPVLIAMAVALVKASNLEVFGVGERATIYLACCIVILFCGPGKISIDGMVNK